VTADVFGWAVTGLVVGVLAPGLLTGTRRGVRWDRLAVPAGVALPGFVVLHAAITFLVAQRPPPAVWLILHVPLLLGALVYWLPILGTARRLSDPLRVLYLFLSAPALDLAGVMVVILGDGPGGLAMIAGMLPAGGIAILVTWQWISREDEAAVPWSR
jgi:cytochrome c oxidase assembly factor CtaG